MTIQAKFGGTCPECKKAINVGDSIEYRKGEKATHAECYKRFFEISMGGGKIAVFAKNIEAAKTELQFIAQHLYDTGCDAEYYNDSNCKKQDYHDINCTCEDCLAAENEVY